MRVSSMAGNWFLILSAGATEVVRPPKFSYFLRFVVEQTGRLSQPLMSWARLDH
jgi:hypothetical protein